MSETTAWLPPGWAHPLMARLPTGHHLRPITAADVGVDLPAVMGSQERLWSIYGAARGWPPATMTAEQDRDDLARQEDETARHASFSYALLDPGETELLGCVHVDPPQKPGADAEVSWWVVDWLVDTAVEAALDEFVPEWVRREWPLRAPRYPGRDLGRAPWSAAPARD